MKTLHATLTAAIVALGLTGSASADPLSEFAPKPMSEEQLADRNAYLVARHAAGGNPKFEPICTSRWQRKCWFDAHYWASIAMEEKMSAYKGDDYVECIRSKGWREPLNQDERCKPKLEFRR
jgi:hypothetical protein